MIPTICVIIGIIVTFYAAYSDFKWGIIPNKLTFSTLLLGLLLNTAWAVMMSNIPFLTNMLIFVGSVFAICYFFYWIGAWSGGDVKLLTALAALVPYRYSITDVTVTAPYPFPFTIIINSIISLLPYLMFYTTYIVFKEKKHLVNELLDPIRNYKKILVTSIVLVASINFAKFFTHIYLYSIVLTVIFTFLIFLFISKLQKYIKLAVILSITFLILFIHPYNNFISIISIFITLLIFSFLLNFFTRIVTEALRDDVKVEDLKEGMILAYDLVEKNGKIFFDSKPLKEKIKECLRVGNIGPIINPGRILIKSMAAGLSEKDIKLLEKLVKEKKLENKIKIKKGIPFGPAIFIGFLISVLFGDIISAILEFVNYP